MVQYSLYAGFDQLGNKIHIGKHLATFGFEPVSHPEPPDAFCTTDSAFLEGKKKGKFTFFANVSITAQLSQE